MRLWDCRVLLLLDTRASVVARCCPYVQQPHQVFEEHLRQASMQQSSVAMRCEGTYPIQRVCVEMMELHEAMDMSQSC